MGAAEGRPGRELVGIGGLLAADLFWGVGNVFVKLAHTPAVAFATYRLWLGFAVFAVISAATRRPISWRTARASLVGGLAFGLYMIALYAALNATSVADVSIIGALQPGLVLAVAGRLFGERGS